MTQDEAMETLMRGEVDVDGVVDGRGIRFIGKATLVEDKWRCLADVGGALCIVEVNISILEKA